VFQGTTCLTSLDNHASRLSIAILNYCMENSVVPLPSPTQMASPSGFVSNCEEMYERGLQWFG
jgi:hypothetical protein